MKFDIRLDGTYVTDEEGKTTGPYSTSLLIQNLEQGRLRRGYEKKNQTVEINPFAMLAKYQGLEVTEEKDQPKVKKIKDVKPKKAKSTEVEDDYQGADKD